MLGGWIGTAQECVAGLSKMDALGPHPACEPLVTVAPNLGPARSADRGRVPAGRAEPTPSDLANSPRSTTDLPARKGVTLRVTFLLGAETKTVNAPTWRNDFEDPEPRNTKGGALA